MSRRLPWLHVGAAVAFLLVHVALGTPTVAWWYAVPPLAMLGFASCEVVRKPWHAAVAFSVMLGFSGWQASALLDRATQERNLWVTGEALARLKPTGTLLLEPAGMIPYQNPQFRVIDDVGLLEPWMAERRRRPGWRTAAIDSFRPDWVIVRAREYMRPDQWMVGSTAPYNTITESRLQDYRLVLAPGVEPDSGARFRVSLEASSLLVFQRK